MDSPGHIVHRPFEYPPDMVGLVLLDAFGNPLYVNSTARQVISYALGQERMSENTLGDAIRTKIPDLNDSNPRSAITLISGRRKYECRKLLLERGETAQEQPYCALVFERISRRRESLRRMVEQYGLTPRERQVASLLVEGLTSKEIAQQMDISTHTVKGYLHFVMTKVGVTTRSGIVGKLGSPPAGDDSKKKRR
jgi:DNA-binding CsgD family transcriptional regulator